MIKRINLKIISNFYACDRLDELDYIPILENGNIDYWKASELLCKKDGGRLPTMKELVGITSYIHQKEKYKFEDNHNLYIKNKLLSSDYYWSDLESSATTAYYRGFYSDGSYWGRYGNRSCSRVKTLCVGR